MQSTPSSASYTVHRTSCDLFFSLTIVVLSPFLLFSDWLSGYAWVACVVKTSASLSPDRNKHDVLPDATSRTNEIRCLPTNLVLKRISVLKAWRLFKSSLFNSLRCLLVSSLPGIVRKRPREKLELDLVTYISFSILENGGVEEFCPIVDNFSIWKSSDYCRCVKRLYIFVFKPVTENACLKYM